MPIGRSLRIYLDGGEVSGIRHAELVNSTGQALLCPRSRIAQLVEWETVARRPGVYFLFGAEQVAAREVYIGESESVLERLKQHLADNDFWQEAVLFTSKDENLTKSHVKHLESRIVGQAKAAGRYAVRNGNQPTQSGLPRADRDAMEEFLQQLPLLLGVLGHRVLDPVTEKSTNAAGIAKRVLQYSVKEATARGAVTDEGFVVLKDSTALAQMQASLPPGWAAIKEELIKTGKLAPSGQSELHTFIEDTLFTSPSAAAAVVAGSNINGRIAWKTADGTTLKELEEQEAAHA